MNKKHIVFGGMATVSKEEVNRKRQEEEGILLRGDIELNQKVKERLAEEDYLVHTEGRIVVKLDMKNKDSYTFENGTTIRRERNFNNFNRRETQPVNAIVISGEGIPKNAELLVGHNSFHETNRINDYKSSFDNEESERVRYFSIPEYECFAWRENEGEWHPIPPFEFGLRVFKPYQGLLQNIAPTQLTDTLFVTSGSLKGNVVKTLLACDYQIIYQDINGRENYLIIFRPDGEEKKQREPEAIAILNQETEQVLNGELLVGYSLSDAKKINDAN